MTARELQKAIAADLTDLFKDRQYTTPSGEPAAIKAFRQQLPKRKSDDDDEPFPYIIVRLDSGGIENQTASHKVAVLLLIGICDDSPENTGHDAVMEIIEVIQQHYQENPFLQNGEFKFTDPFNWVLQDEESYPYFFGAANLVWEATAPRRKVSKYT